MTRDIVFFIFWGSGALLFYTYAAFPLLVWISSKRRSDDLEPGLECKKRTPTVTLLISAHNEEAFIRERICNALALDYPRERLNILVASDGSEDNTNQIVREFESERLRLIAYDFRRGKAATLNSAIAHATGEIVVFSDANTMFKPDAIQRLVRWFAVPQVGVVCGRLILTDAESGRNVDGLYWRYETFIKKCEGKLGGLLGANGAIYAMRRELFCPIPDNTIVDDFVIPLLAKLTHGFRIVYDETAIAHEETPPTIGHEFRRRVRIGSGDYQSFTLLWPLLNPRHGWTCFTFICHKLLRWFSPFLLLLAFTTNIFLLLQPLYLVTFLAQCSFYATAAVGMMLKGNGKLSKAARAASLFCSVNAALFLGFVRWATTVQTGTWQRTERETDLAS